jgi:hypothetical protein
MECSSPGEQDPLACVFYLEHDSLKLHRQRIYDRSRKSETIASHWKEDAEHLYFESSVLMLVHFISPVAASRGVWAS